ncbi:unnamed protein product, partial [Hapterophycus canaliculatus]
LQESSTALPARALSLLERALEHHEGHLKGADDAGSGVAHSNMGLCHGLMGDYPKAAKHHQEALRVALRVQSASAQSVAVGNLGTLAMRQGDPQTAQACLEQHLQLAQQLGDWQGEINAWSRMAQLAAAAVGVAAGVGMRGAGQEGERMASSSAATEGCGVAGSDGSGGIYPRRDGAGVGHVGGGNNEAVVGDDAVARALWCYERAASLAKAHDEASALS